MAYSVSFVTRYIKSLLENDLHLQSIKVEGEVSNITYQSNGNIYFTLKDDSALLPCVMFKSNGRRLAFRPDTGSKIEVSGRISLYEPNGKYQLIATSIKACGQGELYRRFMELKEELEEAGMFDSSYKRLIPSHIRTLGVITSPTGAAIRDIISIATGKNPYISIILYPALVQGEGAKESLARGICTLDSMGLDVIILGRGGGSLEDLWAFNERIVAEAIFASNTPIISAVGHETDFSISDYVADLRAPTPTAAAEIAVYSMEELKGNLAGIYGRLNNDIYSVIEKNQKRAEYSHKHILSLSPKAILNRKRVRLQNVSKLMYNAMKSKLDRGEKLQNMAKLLDNTMLNKLELSRENIKRMANGLNALSPAARLSQGYSYITDSEGKNIYKKDDVSPGDRVNIRVCDGDIIAEVREVI